MSEIRILYVAGPGDVAGTFRHWLDGRDDPRQIAVTYSSQFFDVCAALPARGLVLSNWEADSVDETRGIRVLQAPHPAAGRTGFAYHLGQLRAAWRILREARRFRPHVAVVAETTHWFLLIPLAIQTRVVPSLHSRQFHEGGRISPVTRVIRRLNRSFFRRCRAVMCVSQAVAGEIRAVGPAPVALFIPTYRPAAFSDAPPPATRPFRVLFAGRVEAGKGIPELVEIAKSLRKRGRADVTIDICGEGSLDDWLRNEIRAAGLEESVRLHGHATSDRLRDLIARSHVVVAPTRTSLNEGLNKAVLEGVCGGRPVITSRACPALELARDAAVEVPPDDWRGYEAAILSLADDEALYRRKAGACGDGRKRIMMEGHGWSEVLTGLIRNAP